MEGTLANGGMRMLGPRLPGSYENSLAPPLALIMHCTHCIPGALSAQLKYLRPLNNSSGNQANPKLTATQRQRGEILYIGIRVMVNDDSRALSFPEPSLTAVADRRGVWMSIHNIM